LYSKADAVIALCRKSCKQLKSWQYDDYQYELVLMPNGVNALPRPTKTEVKAFRKQWNLAEDDEIFGFVGRLGEEKNLPLLIKSFERHIAKKRPKAKLLFVGDFEYRKTLEEMAAATKYADRIIFTGAMPREKLGLAYSVLDVFAFPSLKDTQGWVLHEAAHAGLPIVLVDKELSEVVQDGVNGFIANDNPTSFGRAIITLLEDADKRQEFGAISKKLAAKFTENRQVKKLEKLYQELIAQKAADASHDPDHDA
jgi:glycosyltransferase, family 1